MSLRPRWRKVLADLWVNKVRTVLVVLSIAVGVFAVGMMSVVYVLLPPDMDTSFQAINPAGGVMSTSGFESSFLASLMRLPGAGRMEARTRTTGLKVHFSGAPTRDLALIAAPDFTDIELDRLRLVAGSWPDRRQVAIERYSQRLAAVKIGDRIQVELPGGDQVELQVSGFIIDRTVDPSSPTVQGYISPDTLESLGQARLFNYLLYTTDRDADDPLQIAALGRQIEDQFASSGGTVKTEIVREPGKHPYKSSASAIVGLMAALGLLTILLSAFLVINTISSLVGQQVRQIGVMKAFGAGTGQIFGMYAAMLVSFGLMALLIAAPSAIWFGHQALLASTTTLNYEVQGLRVPMLSLAVMTALSVVVPLVAGLVPVLNGAGITVRAAIGGYGLSLGVGRSAIDRAFAHLHWLSRPLLISLRNTVRRKGRLALTLATLVLGGGIFMGVMSARASLAAGIDHMFYYLLSDVNIDFDRSYRVDSITEGLRSVPDVVHVEGWLFADTEALPPKGRTAGEGRAAIDRFTLIAPPPDSTLVQPQVLNGRWLLADDQNAIILTTTTMLHHPEWRIGSTVRARVNGNTETTFVIVGTIAFTDGDNQIAVGAYDYLADLTGKRGQANRFRVVTSAHDPAAQDRVRDRILTQLNEGGYRATVASGHTTEDGLGSARSTILMFLLGMALLITLVGGLGLMGTMSMNVLERTREIGVMRSIGATNGAIMRLVVVEGVLTGLLSWLGASALGLPIGRLLSSVLGKAVFGTPFSFVFEPAGVVAWLVIVVVLSTVASILPAWNASRLTIREVLAYE